jgi:hypothetical protein
LAFVEKNAIGFLTIKMVSPTFAGDGEVRNIPPAFAEVFLDKEFSFIFVNRAHQETSSYDCSGK